MGRSNRVKHFGFALAVWLSSLAFMSAVARAGTITADPRILGAGSISGPDAYSCAGGPDDRLEVACQTLSADGLLTLEAHVPGSPPGHWSFAGWRDCPMPNGLSCTISAPFENQNAHVFPVAVFDDGLGPAISITRSYSTGLERTVTFSFGGNEPLSGTECRLDNGSVGTCTSPVTLTVPEGTHSFEVRGTDRSGNVGAFAANAFTVVDTTIVAGPGEGSFVNARTATFVFATLAGAAFDCALDHSAFAACGAKDASGQAAQNYGDLSEGEHTFDVRGRNGSVLDLIPASRRWIVDTIPPNAHLDRNVGPQEGAVQMVRTETFRFDSDEPSTFECQLDDGPFAACASPHLTPRLGAGAHRFAVRARDRAANIGPADSRDWSVLVRRVGAGVLYRYTRAGRRTTRLLSLRVTSIPSGSALKATCPRCPKGARRTIRRKVGGSIRLKRFARRIKAGARITIVVTHPGMIGTVATLQIRRRKPPKFATRCLAPGASQPSACPT